MVEIKHITRSDLADYIKSEEFRGTAILPITTHRATSYLHNPRSNKNDVVLFLAYLNGRLVAYLGVFPDTLFLNEKAHRVGWLSCMFVDPLARGQGIAKRFMQEAFAAWDDAIAVTEFTPEAGGLYKKTGRFMELHQSVGARFYLRADMRDILSRKFSASGLLMPLYKLGDEVFNNFYKLELNRWNHVNRKNDDGEFKMLSMDKVDDQTDVFIRSKSVNNIERRGKSELNWIRENPWILNAENPTSESRRYHFTAVDKKFENEHFVLTHSNRQIAAYCMLTVRNRIMKVPYCYADDRAIPPLCSELVRRMITHNCSTLLVFHPKIVRELSIRGQYPFLHKRTAVRNYLISKKFESILKRSASPTFQDGDADPVFT